MITLPTENLTGDTITDLLAALRADLKHAEQALDEGIGAATVVSYNTGYRDALQQVIRLVERTQR